jgi:hypothetical protein
MIRKHKDDIEKLATELLEKETLDLLDIVRILGERPFPMTESIKDYMKEIEIRKKDKLEKEEAEKHKSENLQEKEDKSTEEKEAKPIENIEAKPIEEKDQTTQK